MLKNFQEGLDSEPIIDIMRAWSKKRRKQLNFVKDLIMYDGPGRGRKQCPNCKKYIGVRNYKCQCGHVFTNTVVKNPVRIITDSPGRGRKQCPNCRKYVGAKTYDCPHCGYDFPHNGAKPTTEVIEKPTSFESPGRGRKQCPNCQKYVGVRCKICNECNYSFETQVVEEKKVSEDPQEAEAIWLARGIGKEAGIRFVLAPAGDCPIKLKDCTEQGVFDWCEALVSEGKTNRVFYAPSAYRLFLHHFLNEGTKEFNEANVALHNWFLSKGRGNVD